MEDNESICGQGCEQVEKKTPFSAAMCVYGGDSPVFLDEAIASIINQSVKPDEIVLAVDGPIPKTIHAVIDKYIEKLKEIDFKVVYLEKNMGHGEARRASISACRNDLIALMDADDISVPDRFERQLRYYRAHPSVSVIGGYIAEFIDSPERIIGKRIVPEGNDAIIKFMKKRCPMNQVSVMLKKKDIEAVGGYIDWYCEEDYYLWIRLCLAGYKFVNMPEVLVNVRAGHEMYQRRGGIRYFKSEARLQRYMLKSGLIRLPRYLINVVERLILQVLMPSRMRVFIFQKFARE